VQNKIFHILLVDDHEMFRDAITRVLANHSEFSVKHCGTTAAAVAALEQHPYDVVLLDFDLGEEVATRLVPRIRNGGFSGKIIILSASVSENAAWQLAEARVDGIVLKHSSTAALIAHIHAALRGEPCSDPMFERALARVQDDEASSPWPDLTPRERETLRHVIQGRGNKEIAAEFDISENAVKATLQRLFNKTGARTRSDLVRITLQNYAHEL
jgi:two-component system, NarL family, nitrate/nitrite response regulator NarL